VSRKSGKTILVVDDDRPTLSLVASLLKTLGHEVETAVSGKAALEAIERKTPDLVLLDISLPYMDGYDVAMMLRERLGRSLPIVALTGRPGRDARRAAEAGFAAWLEKPFDVPELVKAINGQLKARSA
jgi:CheY-like chemotaxis protein